MAIVRESAKFKIGPIGVSRASQAASIEGQAIQQSLSSLGQLAFEQASRYASEQGAEAAQMATVVDPETGLPVPLEPPEGFGTVASDAYNKVAQARFQSAIDNEIKVKAFELSERYKNNRNGAAQYSQAFQTYLKSMKDAADGPGYKSYISDLGDSYHDGTFAKMVADQAARERQELAESAALQQREGLDALEHAAKMFGPDSEQVRLIESQVKTGVSNAVNSNLFKRTETINHPKKAKLRKAIGALSYAIKNETDPEILAQLRDAIDSGIPSLVPAKYKSIALTMSEFGSDVSSLAAYTASASETVSDLTSLAATRQQIADREKALEIQQDAFLARNDLGLISQGFLKSASNLENDPSAIRGLANTVVFNVETLRNQSAALIREGGPQVQIQVETNQMQERAIIGGFLNGLSVGLMEHLSSKSGEGETQLAMTAVLEALSSGEISEDSGLDEKTTSYVENISKLLSPLYDANGSNKKAILTSIKDAIELGDDVLAGNVYGPAKIARIRADIEQASNPTELVTEFLETIKGRSETISDYKDAGLDDAAQAEAKEISNEAMALAQGLLTIAIKDLTPDQVNSLQKALTLGNPNDAPESSKSSLIEIFRLVQFNPEIKDKLFSRANSWKESGASENARLEKQAKEIAKIQASISASQTILPYADSIRNETDLNVVQDRAVSVASIINTGYPDLPEEERNAIKDIAAANSATAFLNAFIGTNPTVDQINSFIPVFNGSKDVGTLTPQQQSLIEGAIAYASGTNNIGTKDQRNPLVTDFGTILNKRKNDLKAFELQQKEMDFASSVLSGNEPVTDKSSKALDEQFSNYLQSDFRIFASQEGWSTSPEGQAIISTMMQSNQFGEVMTDRFTALANGSMANFQDTLSVWSNVKERIFAGSVVPTAGAVALDGKTVAMLNYLENATTVLGYRPEDVSRIISNRLELQNDPNAKIKFQTWSNTGQVKEGRKTQNVTVRDRILSIDGLHNIPNHAIDAAEAMFIEQGMLALSDPDSALTYTKALKIIAEDMRKRFVQTDGYVQPIGGSSRTDATIAQAAPNYPDEFLSFVSRKISNALKVDNPVISSDPEDVGAYFLEPLSNMQNGIVTYMVHERLSLNDGLSKPVTFKINEFDTSPLIIKNSDLEWTEFVKAETQNQLRNTLKAAATAKASVSNIQNMRRKRMTVQELENLDSVEPIEPLKITIRPIGTRGE